MKMRNTFIFLFSLFTVLTMPSCTKDQKALKALEGYWTLQYQQINGVIDTQLQGCTWYFNRCANASSASSVWCLSVVNCFSPSFDYNIEYKISDKGTKMIMKELSGTSEREILVLNDHEFRIQNNNSQQGVIVEVYAR